VKTSGLLTNDNLPFKLYAYLHTQMLEPVAHVAIAQPIAVVLSQTICTVIILSRDLCMSGASLKVRDTLIKER
jgi:hypothetical protein